MQKIAAAFRKLPASLEGLLLGRPKTLILLACMACGFSLYYTALNLRIDADTTFPAGSAALFKGFSTG